MGVKPGSVKKQTPENTKDQQASKNKPSPVLQTRSSPKALCNVISQLKANQKACLEETGFGGMVEFRVDGILSKLGLYVVDNFDETKMEIKFLTGYIVITKDLIKAMLGLKNDGIDVLEVKIRLRKSENADMNFKLNLIVLFTSLMGTIKQKGVFYLKILDNITPTTNVLDINWCEYVWSSLKMCKSGWKKGKNDCYFRGPLTFLIMSYVDGTKCNANIVYWKRPPTKVWTWELLSERVVEELNSGGFGHEEIEEAFFDEEWDPIPRMFIDAQQHIDSLKYLSCGNTSCTNANMHKTQEREQNVQGKDGCSSMNSVEALINDGFQAQRNKEGEPLRLGQLRSPKTQQAFETVATEVDQTIEKSKNKETSDIPSFSLGLTQDFGVTPLVNNETKVLTPLMISVYTPNDSVGIDFLFHGRRVVTKSNIMRSPHYQRVMDVDGALISEEMTRFCSCRYLANDQPDSKWRAWDKNMLKLIFWTRVGRRPLQIETFIALVLPDRDHFCTKVLHKWSLSGTTSAMEVSIWRGRLHFREVEE
ncbi:hypothetical protein Tco_1530476 [Tanacetum coccineum]